MNTLVRSDLLVKSAALLSALLLAALPLALLPASALAQADAQAPPLYRIELIVFANRDFDRSEELFEQPRTEPTSRPAPTQPQMRERLFGDQSELDALLDIGPLDTRDATPAGDAETEADADAGADAGSAAEDAESLLLQRFGFRLLQQDDLELRGVWNTLQRLQAYTPILHGGWIQEARPEQQATPFDIAYLGRFNPRGTVTLHLSRFAHVNVELSYLPGVGANDAGRLGEIETGQRFLLKEERRIPRNGELHYLDHPAFGVIIVIRPQPRDTTGGDEGRPAA